MPGPKATPTVLRMLKGDTSRGKKPIPTNTVESRLIAEIPPVPPDLRDQESVDEWDRITKLMAGCGVLSRIDHRILGLYCDAWSLYKESRDTLHDGFEMIGHSGPQLRPGFKAMLAAQSAMHKFLCELGMTPASRVKIHPLDSPKDKLSSFLG